jgi:thiol-disulfide isomerase/thioredoxin
MRYAAVLALALSISAQMLPAKAPVSRSAKEFICSDASGKKIALSSYRGEVVVVQFLSTTCSHCQALSQMLTRLQAEYGPKGFQAIGVAFNEADAAMVRSYVEDHHVGIPVGYAPRDAVLGYLGVSVMDRRLTVPQVVVIDRSGQVRAQSDPAGTPQLAEESYLRGLIGALLK